ncbi:MAG: hypothetical protein GY767_17855 [Shimia sp.]|nr:hypothetical protein [Shimia sp.]
MQTVTVSYIYTTLDISKMAADALGIDEGDRVTRAQVQDALDLLAGKEMGPEGTETDPTKWKAHDGGESPVPFNLAVRFPVEVKLRGASKPVTAHASAFSWNHSDGIGDVTHWRFPGPL